MKKTLMIHLLFALSLFSVKAQCYEKAQCDIEIENTNTHFLYENDSFVYRSIIRHANGIGNDDDAQDIRLTINLSHPLQIISSYCKIDNHVMSFDSINPCQYACDLPALSKSQHIDVVFIFDIPNTHISGNIFISANPGSPVDINLCNNQNTTPFYMTFPERARDSFTELLRQRTGPISISLPDICNWLIDCPICHGGRTLCPGEYLDLRHVPKVDTAILSYKNTAFAKTFRNKDKFRLPIPKDFDKNNFKDYSIILK